MGLFSFSFQIFFIVSPNFYLDSLDPLTSHSHFPPFTFLFTSHQPQPPVLALGSSPAGCFQQRCKWFDASE